MLIPRFSIRSLLIITTVVAVCAVFVHQGLAGSTAAAAVGIAIASFVVTMLCYLLGFVLTWVVAQVTAPSATNPPRAALASAPNSGPAPSAGDAVGGDLSNGKGAV